MRQINSKGLEIIKDSETLELHLYICPAGKKTIGWGHVMPDDTYINMSITQGIAEEFLRADLEKAQKDVESLVTVPLTDNQFSALVSLTFNIGSDIDADDIAEGLGDSTLLKKLNAGDYQGAADEFPKWRKGGGKVLKGLVIRRAKERSLFLEAE